MLCVSLSAQAPSVPRTGQASPRTATLSGRVVDFTTNEPVPGVLVQIGGPANAAEIAAENGTFEFTNLPAGSYNVSAPTYQRADVVGQIILAGHTGTVHQNGNDVSKRRSDLFAMKIFVIMDPSVIQPTWTDDYEHRKPNFKMDWLLPVPGDAGCRNARPSGAYFSSRSAGALHSCEDGIQLELKLLGRARP